MVCLLSGLRLCAGPLEVSVLSSVTYSLSFLELLSQLSQQLHREFHRIKDDWTQPSREAVMAMAGQGDSEHEAGVSELHGLPFPQSTQWGSERGSVSKMVL